MSTIHDVYGLLEPVSISKHSVNFKGLKNAVLTSSSVLLLYTTYREKARAAEVEYKPTRADEFPDAASFYSQYPYKVPKDILPYITACEIKDGNAKGAIEALETFSLYYPMYKLSKEKVVILTNEIKKIQPKNVLEIGTFFGYSALNMASLLPDGSRLTCIEANIENADVARAILDKGLGPSTKARQNVRIVDGISSKVLNDNSRPLGDMPFDFVFLDHDKDCYLSDLKSLESKGMLSENCVIVADNVIFPGAPGYLEYVSGKGTAKKDFKTLMQEKEELKSGRKKVDFFATLGNDSKRFVICLHLLISIILQSVNIAVTYLTLYIMNLLIFLLFLSVCPSSFFKQFFFLIGRYSTRMVSVPFERIGYETQWKQVEDAMSITDYKYVAIEPTVQ